MQRFFGWLVRLFGSRRRIQDLELQVDFLCRRLIDVSCDAAVAKRKLELLEPIVYSTTRNVTDLSRALQRTNDLVCEVANQREDPGALDRLIRNRTVN